MGKAKASASDRDTVTVTFPGGTRVYSREDHGEAFEALAEEFAKKRGGTVE